MPEEEIASALWKGTAQEHSCGFAKLAALSALRDANTGVYRHNELAAQFGPVAVDHALRAVHDQVFTRWLTQASGQRLAEISVYLAGVNPDKTTAIRLWRLLQTYRAFVPESAPIRERKLFVCEVEAALIVLQGESGSGEAVLTKRELQILKFLAEGLTTKEIAHLLDVSVHTIANHRKHICGKVGSRSSAELVAFAAKYFWQ